MKWEDPGESYDEIRYAKSSHREMSRAHDTGRSSAGGSGRVLADGDDGVFAVAMAEAAAESPRPGRRPGWARREGAGGVGHPGVLVGFRRAPRFHRVNSGPAGRVGLPWNLRARLVVAGGNPLTGRTSRQPDGRGAGRPARCHHDRAITRCRAR